MPVLLRAGGTARLQQSANTPLHIVHCQLDDWLAYIAYATIQASCFIRIMQSDVVVMCKHFG